MELTELEKKMMTEGIVFSTSKPIPMLVKDGADGGNYVCNAYSTSEKLELLIYEKTSGDELVPIFYSGKEVGRVYISSYINEDGDRASSRFGDVYSEDPEGSCVDWPWKSDRYEGLSLDTQAKRFFTDILEVYLKEKEEMTADSTDEDLTTDSTDEGSTADSTDEDAI